jgi:hypothetical protein
MGFMKAAIDEAMNLLGNANYAEFVRGVSNEEGEYIHKKLQRGGILGSEEFTKRVKTEVEAYQAAGEGQKVEFATRNSSRMYFVYGGMFIILMAGLGGLYFISVNRARTQAPAAALKAPDPLDQLKFSEWQIQLNPVSGTGESADVLTFEENKFFSAKMNSRGLPYSNYSVSISEDGTITWETIQSDASGSASWRGELRDGKMTGMLSLQEAGKDPQAFSFTSINSRRKK